MAVEGRLRLGPQLRETLARITEEAAGLLAVEGAGLRLVDGDELVRVATWGPDGAVMARERIRLGESLSGRVAASGQPLIVANAEAEPSQDPVYRATAQRHGFRSWLGVPLRDRERVVGVLVMQSRSERRFGPSDVRLLEAFAGQAAVAIENARLFERERERRRQLEAVREVTLKLAGEMELAPLLELITRLAAELLGVGSVVVFLWDEASARLLPGAWHGFDDWMGDLRIGLGEGVAGTVAQRRTGVFVDDYRSVPFAQLTILERTETRAVIGEPLLYQGELRGVITASLEEPDRTFSEPDRHLLSLFAAQAAVAIEHARLHEARNRALAEVEGGRRRAAFLADASERLAGSLDLATTLGSIPELAVPAVAEWCALDLVEPNGRIRRAGIAHANPAKAALAARLQHYPPDREGAEGLPRVLRTGRPLLYAEVTDATLEAAAHGPEHLAILRELGPKSVIIVPLVARGQTLGTVLLATSDARRRYAPEDLRLVEDLARRAALAVDNARLYGEAQEAVWVRDEFLSVAAHELKTPVTSLLGFAQVLLRQFDEQRTPSERLVRRALRAIDLQSRRLSRLVSQLLDLSRMEGGRLVLDRTLTDLAGLVQGVVASVGVNASGHTLLVQASREILAPVDPLRLEQVMTNLLDNAMKYSPDGGRIEVELSQPSPETARLAVRDHGVGIPPELRQRIFDRYYQAHTGDHLSGMGLGLYISRQIAELHGGSIRAEFPDDGGTRFVVDLPTGSAIPSMSGTVEAMP